MNVVRFSGYTGSLRLFSFDDANMRDDGGEQESGCSEARKSGSEMVKIGA